MANKTGFETQIFLGDRTSYRYMGAAALDKNGAIMGSTFVIDMQNGQPVLMPSSIASVWPESEPMISNKFSILMIIGCVVSMGLFLGRFFSRKLHWTTNYETTKYERIESEERRIE